MRASLSSISFITNAIFKAKLKRNGCDITIYSPEAADKLAIDKDRAVCFTGHRDIPSNLTNEIVALTDSEIRRAINGGALYFIAGGAPGYDTIAACRVIVLRREFPNIKLILALPCRNQTARWTSLTLLKLYKHILGEADDILYLSDLYFDGCMRERNIWMTEHSTRCIAYCTKAQGGSAQTLRLAQKGGLRTVNIANDPLILHADMH